VLEEVVELGEIEVEVELRGLDGFKEEAC